jgi:hypothetical protein|tara:strand:- start:162 stop:659 length:498 start_codon:yes stop_codon:yes gene_type:complete
MEPDIDTLRAQAEQGDANAQYRLGGLYRDGTGVQQDYTEAVRWYRLAAEQGLAEAQFVLGGMYAFGGGVPQDAAEAVRWFRLAAEQGYARAQASLGLMYDTGEGVTQDDVQAHMWFNLAASRPNAERRDLAVGERDRVAGQMTPTQIAEAERLATEWDAAHPREP